MHKIFLATAVLATIGGTPPAHALPMGSNGSWMVMGDLSARSRDFAANVALTTRDALGASAGRWRTEPEAGGVLREYGALTYTRLLQRWNLPHAQANLWLVGSVGSLRDDAQARTHTMWSPLVMADFETTRLYFSAGLKMVRASPVRQDTAYARAGFSFYEVEYDEVQPWVVVETKRQRDGVRKDESAAWLRLVHKRFFLEAGADDEGRARLNFMLNY